MKKILIIALIYAGTVTTGFGKNEPSAQALSFAGPSTWTAGTAVQLDVNLIFSGYGAFSLSYWLEVPNALAPFLSITGAQYFTFLDPNSLQPNPAPFNSTSGATSGYMCEARDLGATRFPGDGLPPGAYPITNLTFALAAGAPPGVYTLRSTTVNPRISFVTDTSFNDYLLPAATFTIIVVPGSGTSGATWSSNPPSANWNAAGNWTPMIVPSFPVDMATFQTSSQTSVSLSASVEINGITFDPGANQFSITSGSAVTLAMSGAGITNNSGTTQNFILNGPLVFNNSATAGSLTNFQNRYTVSFGNSASAGTATFDNNTVASMTFNGSSTAANATITNSASAVTINFNDLASAGSANVTLSHQSVATFRNLSTAANAHFALMYDAPGYSATVAFVDSATAGNSTLTENYGTISFSGNSSAGSANVTSSPGSVTFRNLSTAADAHFCCSGSISFMDSATAGNSTLSGSISFSGNSDAGTATLIGYLNISGHAAPGVTVPSLEGGGVSLGSNTLTVGGNNLSTTVSGRIDGSGGVLVKTGTGALTLNNSNTYSGGTRIDNGTVRASHDGALGGVPLSYFAGTFVMVGPNATLVLDSGVTNDYISDVANLIIVANSTVNLNFTGNPDKLRCLTVDGVAQPPGIYGGPGSGAPNQLPQFTGPGTIAVLSKAVSRKIHGDAGPFDIDLPVGDSPGIECRSGGANGDYQVVITFLNNVVFTDVVLVTFANGYLSSYSGLGTNTVTANLTAVSNAQLLYVVIRDLNDAGNNFSIPMAVLVGDINANGTVNASDVALVKAQLGQPVTSSNFRADVNPNGMINASDIIRVKLQSGTSLP